MTWTSVRGALPIAVLCLSGLALAPAVTSAQANLYAERVGDMIQVDVSAVWSMLPVEWTGLVVQRWTVGVCDDWTTVTPEPWRREAPPRQYSVSEYSLLSPVPGENRCYGYAVKAMDADGQLHAICGLGDMPFDYVSCGLAIVARGFLILYMDNLEGPPRLVACTEDCWQTAGWDIDFGAVDPATYSSYVSLFVPGIPVDIYGRIEVSGMIPNMWIVASQVLPSPSGLCGPLPVKSTSWGQVKTSYR